MKEISPQQWSEIESILDEALEADPADRAAVVEHLCDGDDDLKSRVMSLLRAGNRADDFLEKPQQKQFEKALRNLVEEEREEEEDPHLDRSVGPYRLIRRLGRGGMGQVYLGSRDDDAFEKFVAVKVIRRGMDTDEILQRFRTERRILASLVHPNIARLLDGGATADGLSYFVMDYVDGVSITEYADEKRLSVRARLELFKKVCSAVHYAHQNLIVHRDLKPSNILVDLDGEVKLLDFGIAKFMHPEELDYTVPVTRPEVRIMTPEYASPEQARGEAITTASDVYQLGILLYELLTGTRPYQFSNERRAEIERIICETEPERPSTAITNTTSENAEAPDPGTMRNTPIERLRKQLSGDLDRIVLMALRKEADRRYQSADQFLEDINRYLLGLPVTAQSDTWLYRAAKFTKRHRIGVVATATVAVLLVTVSVIAVQSAVTTARQNEQIKIALEKKDQVTDLMIGMFEVADPEIARGREITARELLDRSAERIELELTGQPDVQAEMFHSVGTVYRQLGYLDEAGPLLERALAMRREIFGDEDNEDLAQSLFDMALWYEEQGDAEQSIQLHNESLAMRDRLFTRPNAAIAQSENELGVVYYELLGEINQAEQFYDQALEQRLALEGPESREISETMVNLAAVLHDRDDFEEAEIYYRLGLAMQRKLLGNDHPFVATTLYNYGSLMKDMGSYDLAEQYVREALELRIQLYGERNQYVANSQTMLGQVLNDEGAYLEAQSVIEKALEQHLSEAGGRTGPRVGRDLQVLAWSRRGQGDLEEASALLGEAIEIFSSFFSNGHWLLAEARTNLAQVRVDQGRFGEAGTLLQEVLSFSTREFSEASPEVAQVRLQLGRVRMLEGRYDEARDELGSSRDILSSFMPTHARDLQEVNDALGELELRSAQSDPGGS